ncbi:MAG: hypothetical protein RLZZ458_406 [Planctomycetota bacterium]
MALALPQAVAQQPREAGFNELLVIEPQGQESGQPTAVIKDGKVEIPPTLHVHPYYYSGDKEYQAQILNGGPTIIVANHPKSGEKLYIDAVLPAGAPIVAYSAHSITYVYTDRRVCIEFHLLHHDRAIVKYISGRGLVRETHEQLDEVADSIDEHRKKSRLMTELGELKTEAKDIAKGSVGVITGAGAVAVERVRAVTRVLPGAAALRSLGKQAEERAAKEETRQLGILKAKEESLDIPTIR